MRKIDLLVNDNFKVLETIYDNTVSLMDNKYCPLSQMEIATLLGINRITCANIINTLKKENLVDKTTTSNKHYVLTEEAIQIVKKMKKI